MSTTTQRPTPETDDIFDAYARCACGTACVRAKMQQIERERDEAREQIASCAINTNVRLFDLVRYMRSELHQASLITDEEYSWLCNGCEMANSPQGGSPSPRRLEDYDVMSEQLEAMREAIREAHEAFKNVMELQPDVPPWANTEAMLALAKLQPFLKS